MKYLKYIITAIRHWLNNGTSIKYRFAANLPNRVRYKKIYIVGYPNYPWMVTFKCPCGCDKTIQLNLLEDASPCWSYMIKKGKITLEPSVWGTTGCKSHFVVLDGKVYWA